jgi:hypothetical protein
VRTYRATGDMALVELAQSYDLLKEVAKDMLRAEFAVRLDPPIIEEINQPTKSQAGYSQPIQGPF